HCVGEPCYDFILRLEQIDNGLVEPLRPQMIAGRRVDQLHVDPKTIDARLHRAIQHVPNIELAPQRFNVYWPSLKGEGNVARDDQRATDAGQVRGQALREAIHKMVMDLINAKVREWQDHDRQPRRGRRYGCWP